MLSTLTRRSEKESSLEINPKSRSLYTMSIVENLPSSSVRERDISLISRVRQREESESSTSFLLRLFGFTYVSLLDSEAAGKG